MPAAVQALPSTYPPVTRPSPAVRAAIREVLTAAEGYQALDPETRSSVAHSLVKISSAAVALAREADEAHRGIGRAAPMAQALNAGSEFSGVAAERVAGTTRQILNAVSFPRFVTELINGVFKAMVDSNQQQMKSYVDLIRAVSSSVDGFADANIGAEGARQWLADRFPDAFVFDDGLDEDERRSMTPEERRDTVADVKLTLRPNATPPNPAALKAALGLREQEDVPAASNPESLVPFARLALARSRQQMLSTMVMLGMQRIVIDSGRINAAMRFHIDTRSAAAADSGSTFDTRTSTGANVGAKVGPWGVDANIQSTIGYVSTQRTQTTEEMNTDLDLNSSVELVFRTDYVPLERLAGTGDVNRIRVNTLNPEAEARAAERERTARLQTEQQSEQARLDRMNPSLSSPPPLPARPPSPPTRNGAPAASGPAPGAGSVSPSASPTSGVSPSVSRSGTSARTGGTGPSAQRRG